MKTKVTIERPGQEPFVLEYDEVCFEIQAAGYRWSGK